jgi:hypothetical protein
MNTSDPFAAWSPFGSRPPLRPREKHGTAKFTWERVCNEELGVVYWRFTTDNHYHSVIALDFDDHDFRKNAAILVRGMRQFHKRYVKAEKRRQAHERFKDCLTWAYRNLFIERHSYSCKAIPDDPARTAEKVISLLLNRKYGELNSVMVLGVEAACKQLGIPRTYKGLEEYLNP